jgi:NAD(P)-dependent dehydrogenase (short-subunit alcohol dehydrogenase family)
VASFAGKTALVTGATSGIGRATAVAFARAGASVVLTGRREDEGRSTLDLVRQAGGRGTFVRGDVTAEDDVRRMVQAAVQAYGGLDCAFNNAGYLGAIAPVTGQSLADLDATLDVNVRGTLLCLRYELETTGNDGLPATAGSSTQRHGPGAAVTITRVGRRYARRGSLPSLLRRP